MLTWEKTSKRIKAFGKIKISLHGTEKAINLEADKSHQKQLARNRDRHKKTLSFSISLTVT